MFEAILGSIRGPDIRQSTNKNQQTHIKQQLSTKTNLSLLYFLVWSKKSIISDPKFGFCAKENPRGQLLRPGNVKFTSNMNIFVFVSVCVCTLTYVSTNMQKRKQRRHNKDLQRNGIGSDMNIYAIIAKVHMMINLQPTLVPK